MKGGKKCFPEGLFCYLYLSSYANLAPRALYKLWLLFVKKEKRHCFLILFPDCFPFGLFLSLEVSFTFVFMSFSSPRCISQNAALSINFLDLGTFHSISLPWNILRDKRAYFTFPSSYSVYWSIYAGEVHVFISSFVTIDPSFFSSFFP